MKRIGFAIAAVVWMGLIFWISTPTGSTENTRPIVAILMDWIQPGLSASLGAETLGQVDWVFRKVAHVTEYAILASLFLGASDGQPRLRRSLLSLTLAVLYAASDEWHQSAVPGRYATLGDVGWDAAGASLATIGHWAMGRRRKGRRAGA